ncbi:baeRF2 domain-containing protein [Cellulomonas bogoriensis]|uniref:Peptide chain release factor 1 n=1 Tax=Cellulomonas bogoriensis 69B4 = DSM 16987 TaxID=1386082 RepID=A0A0A0BY46_9CELL|nr:Vms1/Ankzf1 family peptidyl-tRNA hydrolase [Cellulomonas bogoriensis]KGM13298.1 hypothetical protein N869_16685 [Cellulomonas bogoriensis 69B4 = DSM 16987]
MKLDSLKPLLDRSGSLTTVSLDVTRAEDAGDRDIRSRWNGLRRQLESQGAPEGDLQALAEVVLRPTHVPGPHGRFVVAGEGEVLFDRVLADAPPRDEAYHDGIPALMPAAQAADEAVRYLLVEVDRSGADLSWSGSQSHAADQPMEAVEGGHDVLHKVRAGGWSHRRMQSRVEDSWDRNAEVVAAELDRAVVEHRPDLVMITGDVRAVPLIRGAVGQQTAELLVEVPGGSRAEGVKEEAFAENVHAVLEAFRARRREDVADRLREALGRGEGAVTSLPDVVEVLRRGQVSELIVIEDAAGSAAPLGDHELWAGPEPLHLGMRASEIAALGVDEKHTRAVRGDVALLRAALAQDAGVTFLLEGSVDVVDGVAALLRWNDQATPHETAPSYTEDTHRKGH